MTEEIYAELLTSVAKALVVHAKTSSAPPEQLLTELTPTSSVARRAASDAMARAKVTPRQVSEFLRANPASAARVADQTFTPMFAEIGSVLRARGIDVEEGAIKSVEPASSQGWRETLDDAIARSRSDGKPALLFFTAEWSTACKALDRETFSNEHVKSLLRSQFHSVRIDVTNEDDPAVRALQERFRVTGLPTVIVLDKGSDETLRLLDFLTADELVSKLRGIR
jgi:thiol:disulfide interchange protein